MAVSTGEIGFDEQNIIVNGHTIRIFKERDPGDLPWASLGVAVVLESTGFFTAREKAEVHITKGGAKKVLISAPANNPDATICMGVNGEHVRPREASHRLERELHHQLPRPHGQGPQRRLRHRNRLHEHDPLLHQRPAHPRPARTRISAAPAPPPSTSSPPRPAPPRPSARSFPPSRASSTAALSASRPRTVP